jgi:hypothetical protein
MATVKGKIAVLFTCSAHKDYYAKYSPDFFKAVQSLQVFGLTNLAESGSSGLRPSSETLGTGIGAAMPNDMMTDASTEATEGTGGGTAGTNKKTIFIGIAIALAAIGGYLFMKSREG